jgi:hypothetical protein
VLRGSSHRVLSQWCFASDYIIDIKKPITSISLVFENGISQTSYRRLHTMVLGYMIAHPAHSHFRMDIVPIVCTVTAIAASIVALDGRRYPATRTNDYVENDSSVWPSVRANPNQNAWFVRYLRCSRSTFFRIADRLVLIWSDVHPALHHAAHFDVIDRTAVALYYLSHCDGFACAALVFGIGKTKVYIYVMEIVF